MMMNDLNNLIFFLSAVFGLTWLCNRHGRVKIISMEEQFIMVRITGQYFTYLFKNGLASQVMVFRLQSCLFLPRTREIYYNQLAELVATFLYSECYRPEDTSTRDQ